MVDAESAVFRPRTVASAATAARYAAAMTTLARALSILGHPLLVLPLALLLAMGPDAVRAQGLRTLAGFALFGGAVMAYSRWQVRRGRWRHVDASHVRERGALNRFLLVALGAGALLAWRFAPPQLALGLLFSLLIVAVALVAARWCKLSLHVAFAVYAAALLWPLGLPAVLCGLAFAGALGWSRLRLARHAPVDLVAGAGAGAVAGALFWWSVTRMGMPHA